MTELLSEFSEQSGFPVEIPEKCRQCVTLARFALRYEEFGKGIKEIEEAGLSEDLAQRWVRHAVTVSDMTVDEAEEFVSARELELRANLVARLERMDKGRERQVELAQFILGHCEPGVVKLVSVTPGVDMEAEACGSSKPERVKDPAGAEILRVDRKLAVARAAD